MTARKKTNKWANYQEYLQSDEWKQVKRDMEEYQELERRSMLFEKLIDYMNKELGELKGKNNG